jgi:hypothetical protein
MTEQQKKEADIRLVIAYTWSQIGRVIDFSFSMCVIVEMLATQFVMDHQLPDEEYGIGEDREMDWDEHVEKFMLKGLHDKGVPVNR